MIESAVKEDALIIHVESVSEKEYTAKQKENYRIRQIFKKLMKDNALPVDEREKIFLREFFFECVFDFSEYDDFSNPSTYSRGYLALDKSQKDQRLTRKIIRSAKNKISAEIKKMKKQKQNVDDLTAIWSVLKPKRKVKV
jgi:hypothetical protein